jgi:hypothetical protein
MFYKSIVFAAALFIINVAASAQVASNPPYTLEQSVIAGGGGASNDAGNTFSVTGSIGQPITGTGSSATTYQVKSGFFTAAPLAATAASVTIGGTVRTATGRGIRNAVVVLTNASGALRYATTGAFGYFRFDNIPAGETYVLRIKAKRFEFAHGVQILFVSEDTDNIEFIANL